MPWRLLTVLERDPSASTSLWVLWNFQESVFAEQLLATTSHMILFFSLFVDQWDSHHFMWWSNDKLGEKNSQTGSSLCRHGNQVQAWLSSCGHIWTNLEIPNNWRKGRIGRTEKLIKVGRILILCNGRSRNSHIPKKNGLGSFKCEQKVQDFGNETIRHIWLIHPFEVTHY